jgi:hypothetical protein
LQNFVSGVRLAIFSKNARILTVIFIGYRQLDNTFFFYLPTTAYTATPFAHQTFCLYNNYLIFFILLKRKKENRLILCPEKNPVFDIINGNFN